MMNTAMIMMMKEKNNTHDDDNDRKTAGASFRRRKKNRKKYRLSTSIRWRIVRIQHTEHTLEQCKHGVAAANLHVSS